MAQMTLEQLAGWAEKKAREVQRGDYTEALEAIRDDLYQSVFQEFAQARGPDGRPWKPLEDSFRRPLLGRAGRMIARVLRAHRDARIEKARLSVQVPSEVAAFHNFGKQKRPEREFLGFGQADLEKAAAIVAESASQKLLRD
jgi:phage gpG-like protein